MTNITSYIEKYGTRIWIYHPQDMCKILIYSNPWLINFYRSFLISKVDFYKEDIEQEIFIDILVSRNFKLYAWINVHNWETLLHKERDYHLLPSLIYLGKIKPVDNFRKLVLTKWNKSFYKRKSILLYRYTLSLYLDIPYEISSIDRYNEDINIYNQNALGLKSIEVLDISLIRKLNLIPYEENQPLVNNLPYSFI